LFPTMISSFFINVPSSYHFLIVSCHLWHCSCVFSPLISTLIGFAWTKMFHQSNYLWRTFKYETFGRSTSHLRSSFWDFGVITNVGRFLNHHLVFDLILNLVLIMKTGWHNYMWKSDWESTSNSHMNENRSWKLVLIFTLLKKLNKENPIWFSIFQFRVLKQHPLPRDAKALFKVRDNGSCIK
jgi:hypothetical protein